MQLLLVRHAAAEDVRSGLSDADRALTTRGRARFKAAVPGLLSLGMRPARVLSSPLVRARQTAEILAQACECPLELLEALATPPDEELLSALRGGDAAAVGHEPWISSLCAWLVVGQRDASPAFPFKKGGVALLEGQPKPGGMALVAFLPPRALRALGAGD